MSVNAANPLYKHFRQPSIFMKLPSAGRFWTADSINLPVTGELPVYPMTAKDEIILRTPDALMNGQGVIDVVQSCCPAITNAWAMPSVDVDAVLIAIRIASYGNQMDVSLACPHCQHEHEIAVDLSAVLDGIACPNYNEKIVTGSIRIKLKPQTYFAVNQNSKIRYEEERIMAALSDDSVSEEVKLAEYSKHLKKIVDLNLDFIISSTEYIETEDGTIVADYDFIKEFYVNCDAATVRKIEARLEQIAKEAGLKPIENNCPGCTKEYNFPLEFDYARFFAKNSYS